MEIRSWNHQFVNRKWNTVNCFVKEATFESSCHGCNISAATGLHYTPFSVTYTKGGLLTYVWTTDDEFVDQTCSGRIIYQAYGYLLTNTTFTPHHLVMRDPQQQLHHVLNNLNIEICRGCHGNISAVVRQPTIRISYDIMDLGKKKELSTLQGYGGFNAYFSTDASSNVNEKHHLAYLQSRHVHFQCLEDLVYHHLKPSPLIRAPEMPDFLVS